MPRNIQLLVIDPQNDFCDLPAAWQPVDALTGQHTALNGGAHGHHLIGVHRLAGLPRDQGAHHLLHHRHAGGSSHHHDLIQLLGRETSILEGIEKGLLSF